MNVDSTLCYLRVHVRMHCCELRVVLPALKCKLSRLRCLSMHSLELRQLVINALVFNVGKPFRRGLWTNSWLLASLVVLIAFDLYVLWSPGECAAREIAFMHGHDVSTSHEICVPSGCPFTVSFSSIKRTLRSMFYYHSWLPQMEQPFPLNAEPPRIDALCGTLLCGVMPN